MQQEGTGRPRGRAVVRGAFSEKPEGGVCVNLAPEWAAVKRGSGGSRGRGGRGQEDQYGEEEGRGQGGGRAAAGLIRTRGHPLSKEIPCLGPLRPCVFAPVSPEPRGSGKPFGPGSQILRILCVGFRLNEWIGH